MSERGPPLRLQDRYRLAEYLGEGGAGIVYRAHDEMLDRDVAVKFLRPERLAGEAARTRFLREARLVARLSDPNIVTLHDVGTEGQWLYLVLEHILGHDLRAVLAEREGRLSVPQALHIVRGILNALVCAHGQGIIHRDIKPENVMVDVDGQVKVTDLGLALAVEGARITQEKAIVGTLHYLAPEALDGQMPNPSTDLYAVGVVFYELLTGHPPFAGGTPAAILHQILHDTPAPIQTATRDIQHIVSTLLNKDPRQRYGSAAEALSALPETRDHSKDTLLVQQVTPSLLERLVHSSSAEDLYPGKPPTVPETGKRLPPELLVYAATEDVSTAVEAERQKLAQSLQHSAIDPLNLLVAQVTAYEQSLVTTPEARLAFAVVGGLARQALQQARDLKATLHPTTLETLGLEPALESLAGQVMRSHGLRVELSLERLGERLPPRLELALLRLTQDALDRAVHRAHANQVHIQLNAAPGKLSFEISDNGLVPTETDRDLLQLSVQRIEQLGAAVEVAAGPIGGLRLAVTLVRTVPVELTPREMEVIQLLAEGRSNKEMAHTLGISARTINFHLDNIYSKLGVNSRTEAAIRALREGWVDRTR